MSKSKLPLSMLVLLMILVLFCASLGYGFGVFQPTSLPFAVESTPNINIDESYTTVSPVFIEEYVTNPGMGWQKDRSENSDYFPESVVYASRSDISWRILNPGNGVYNWKPIDDQYEPATLSGQQFSFRVFTMAGEEYGGHQVPEWVLNEGAIILSSGEPDYSNCIYQQEWGRFVNALLDRYDGDVNIAYIDISGYGDFNEWGWRADQTEWDGLWEKNYEKASIVSFEMQTVDGQARRRLVDMFIGGSQESHVCRASDGSIQTVRYSYNGAQKTQLIMPFAGIVQSSQYVYARSEDIGFRYDCLGREKDLPFDEFNLNWKKAPVIYEFCGPADFKNSLAQEMINKTHPVLIHNNSYHGPLDDLQSLVGHLGYRYFLTEAGVDFLNSKPGEELLLFMLWKNMGTSPSYPRMGQNFQLHVYLMQQDEVVMDYVLDEDISKWFPAHPFSLENTPVYRVDALIALPSDLAAGTYQLNVSIIDQRTDLPIQIPVYGVNADGSFPLFDINIRQR